MKTADFVIIGSSGGGGTMAWLLANAGFDVVVLELGPDMIAPIEKGKETYNEEPHDEFRFRSARPDLKRRPRGDYNTFRESGKDQKAVPFREGWTGSIYGGGSVIWGTWSFRALPIDFCLGTHFAFTKQDKQLRDWGYSVPDWPVSYREMEPYFNVAETILSVCGERDAINASVQGSSWYQAFQHEQHFKDAGNWSPSFPFRGAPFPETPVGHIVRTGFEHFDPKWITAPLPSAVVTPRPDGKPTLCDGPLQYHTRKELQEALDEWNGEKPEFWDRPAEELWSKHARDSCNMCGFCGEYLCWGKNGPKSGARSTTLRELREYKNVEVICNAKAFEIVYDERTERATGVRYLDIRDPEHPVPRTQQARHVIVACGAVQSARLLFLSRLGNRHDQLGRYATFHLFGLGATAVFPERFLGKLHGQIGHTGNRMTFENYFIRNAEDDKWWKAGTMVSAAKKNPLENAIRVQQDEASPLAGVALLKKLEAHSRTLELRLTGDDLPMRDNRVDLDPTHVDEYGLPVARISRRFGEAEKLMFRLARPRMERVFDPYRGLGTTVRSNDANLRQIGDHQHGTCRMGEDEHESVLNRYCQMWEAKNVFVVDTSFMPTGLGLNPMVNVVANALRVGTYIVTESRKGKGLG